MTDYDMSYEEKEISRLYAPPSSTVQPPVETRIQTLPLDQLSWQDFERLCHRLIRKESTVEYCKQYGTPGEAQSGIDILARTKNAAKYEVFQCKNESNFGPAKISEAVSGFVAGEWRDKSSVFVLCTRESMLSTKRAREIETQAEILSRYGVSFEPWDREELSDRLKANPDIVDDFFGRPWVKAFCGDEATQSLGHRLDSSQRCRLRRELSSLYNRIFNLHDRGVPIADVLPLQKRYIPSDVEWIQTLEPSSGPEPAIPRSDNSPQHKMARKDVRRSRKWTRSYSQRLPLAAWVVRGKRNLLFGEPGSGKSTFLRFLALDLLQDAPVLTDTAKQWGDHVPIWIPFALWTKVIAAGTVAERAVIGIVKASLQSWDAHDLVVSLAIEALKDRRALLLLDGLDEHSNNEAAKIALNHLSSFLEAQDIPVIATTRRHGFERLEMNREDWRQATIAGLSKQQQQALVQLWFRAATKRVTPSLQGRELADHVERQSENFSAERSRSRDIRRLAENPLLLCLLISFQIKEIRLPVNRFDAYAALTDHLISTHPEARRVAAEAAGRDGLPPDDTKKMLAYLAATVHEHHTEGLISETDAIAAIQQYAVDDDHGFGVTMHEAARMARTLVANATNELGILVRRSQNEIGFYHRTIQEYLVSLHLSRLELSDQCQIVADRCSDPLWREVILGLLQITARPADVKLFVEQIRNNRSARIDRQARDQLLAEVAFGNFNCPPRLSKDLAGAAIDEIEHGTWLPHRERLLRHALDGLRSPSTHGLVMERLPLWYQDRFGWSASRIFEAMGEWQLDEEVIETLFRGFNAEDYEVKRAAGLSLARISGRNEIIRNRLEAIVNESEEPNTVAAATEALLQKWSDYPPLVKIVERCRASAVPELRIVGVRGRIVFGKHDDADLTSVLRLADTRSPEYWLRGQVAELLPKGWPGNERLKRACLDSLHGMRGGLPDDHGGRLGHGTALSILLTSYSMDEEIVSFCVDQLRNERYPFLGLHRPNAFSLLAENFKNRAEIVKALDEWVEQTTQQDMDVAAAARVGKTATFKKKLLELLPKSLPHWPAEALLEIWGVSDPDVAAAVDAFIADPTRAAKIGHLLPQVFNDRAECKRYLIQLLQNPECVRPDLVLEGLVRLGTSGSDTEVVDAVLALLAAKRHIVFRDGVKERLILHFLDNPKVRELAIETLNGRNDAYDAIAKACGSDSEIRALLLRLATPLPTRLRQIIASHLAYGDVDNGVALNFLKSYDSDRDAEVKVQSAIGYYSRLQQTEENIKHAMDDLATTIECGGPDYEERRLAAFCGLVLLDRLDIMDSTDGDYGMGLRILQGSDVNVPAVLFVLKHWTKLRNQLGTKFWRCISGGEPQAYYWDALATFVDDYPLPAGEALEFYIQQDPKRTRANGLQFIARVRPGSPLLLDYCLTTLGLTELPEIVGQPAMATRTQVTFPDCTTAAEIMGRHFAEDADLPARLYNARGRCPFNELVLALSEGWPRSEELEQCFREMETTRGRYWEINILRYDCAKLSPVGMYIQLRRLIRAWSSRSQYRSHEAYVRPIVVRLQHDKRLRDILIRHLSSIATPSEKVSICRLLGIAVGLSSELRQWANMELEKQFGLDGRECGFDVTTGEGISVPHAIYRLLNPSSSQ